MASPPLLSDSNWMGANISQSRMNPSLRGANSSAASADGTAARLSSKAPVVIIELVFITVISSPLVVVLSHGQDTRHCDLGYAPACWVAAGLSRPNFAYCRIARANSQRSADALVRVSSRKLSC